jgi:hypothetical protein
LDANFWIFHISNGIMKTPFVRREQAAYSFLSNPRVSALAPALSRLFVFALKQFHGTWFASAVCVTIAREVLDSRTQNLLLGQFCTLDQSHSGFIDRNDLQDAILKMPHTSEV